MAIPISKVNNETLIDARESMKLLKVETTDKDTSIE